MLFNSFGFIFVFLPITLVAFFALARYSHRLAASWLIAASLFFYAWWNPAYIALLLTSLLFNYAIGATLVRGRQRMADSRRRVIILFGVAANLAVLGYYKYANFFLANLSTVADTNWTLGTIILPLGISFFTFTQIAFLVDAYRGEVRECNFIHYSLFVTYFPHLLAGPILHHKEMIPQFAHPDMYRRNYGYIAVGLTVFLVGLFKKSVLADGVAPYAPILFTAADRGHTLTFLEAWAGMLSYTMQLYFDFSGYSDMAIGGSLLFGVKLPLNFYSPYQSVNIFEFWRHWHMTLTRFLRNYVYAPLSRHSKGGMRLYLSLFVTMLLAGIWHGAGWTFIIFGALHGIYMVANHGWRKLRRALGHDLGRSTRAGRALACVITFTAFVLSLVLFRAGSVDTAMAILKGMAGMNGWALPDAGFYELGVFGSYLKSAGVPFSALSARETVEPDAVIWISTLLCITFFLPNTQQIMGKFQPALDANLGDKREVPAWLQWKPNWKWAIGGGCIALLGVISITKVSPFLYYQF